MTPIIDDALWTLIEPLLPPPKPRREKNPGRLPVSSAVPILTAHSSNSDAA